MLRTVDFHDQLPFETSEIKYEPFEGVLSSKFHAELLAAQTTPQQSLGISRTIAQLYGGGPQEKV